LYKIFGINGKNPLPLKVILFLVNDVNSKCIGFFVENAENGLKSVTFFEKRFIFGKFENQPIAAAIRRAKESTITGQADCRNGALFNFLPF